MWHEIQVVGGSVLTLFLMMAVGFFMAKRGMLTQQTLSQMSTLLLYVVAPAIIIDTFLQQQPTPDTLRELLIAAGVMVGTYVLNMVLVQLCFRRSAEGVQGILRFASIYGNTGFMGIPLILAVLQGEGMLLTVTSLAVFNICVWTHGMLLIGGKDEVSVKKGLLNPGVVGFGLAILLFLLQVPVPDPVMEAVGYLGSLNTPLAMVIIGAQMAAVSLPSLLKDGRLYLVSALKLLVVPLITMAVLLPFHLAQPTFLAAVILAGCPVAGITSLFAQKLGKDAPLAAKLVPLSTLLCILTLPVVTLAARALCGG